MSVDDSTLLSTVIVVLAELKLLLNFYTLVTITAVLLNFMSIGAKIVKFTSISHTSELPTEQHTAVRYTCHFQEFSRNNPCISYCFNTTSNNIIIKKNE